MGACHQAAQVPTRGARVGSDAGRPPPPDGTLIALAGSPDDGKSTLVGALIQAGCDYLGDESLGLGPDLVPLGYARPEHALDAVVAVAYRPDVPFAPRLLDPPAALREVCSNVLSLARSGPVGREALCHLATTTPVWKVTHPGVDVVVPCVLGLGVGLGSE